MTSNSVKYTILFNYAYVCLGIVGLFYLSAWTLPVWLFFALGNGTVGHRYFSHSNFSVSRLMHWILAAWATIAAYSPVSYWQVQHRHHHRHTDQPQDIHSPRQGLFMAVIGWPFSSQRIQSVFADRACVIIHARAMRDPAIKFFSTYMVLINLVVLATVGAISTNVVLAMGTAFLFEQLRLGLINTMCHLPNIPGNYRNHDTDESSNNNIFLGILGLGFGWHNNHHADPSKLVLTEHWWELDIEGYVGKLLGKL